MTTDKKVDLLIDIYNVVLKNKNYQVDLKNDLALLFSKFIEVPITDSKDLLHATLNNLPSKIQLFDKLIPKIPNKTILIFRKLIQEKSNFISNAYERNLIIKKIDETVLSKITNITTYAYGSRKRFFG